MIHRSNIFDKNWFTNYVGLSRLTTHTSGKSLCLYVIKNTNVLGYRQGQWYIKWLIIISVGEEYDHPTKYITVESMLLRGCLYLKKSLVHYMLLDKNFNRGIWLAGDAVIN